MDVAEESFGTLQASSTLELAHCWRPSIPRLDSQFLTMATKANESRDE